MEEKKFLVAVQDENDDWLYGGIRVYGNLLNPQEKPIWSYDPTSGCVLEFTDVETAVNWFNENEGKLFNKDNLKLYKRIIFDTVSVVEVTYTQISKIKGGK